LRGTIGLKPQRTWRNKEGKIFNKKLTTEDAENAEV
jgi:hypothetical protein